MNSMHTGLFAGIMLLVAIVLSVIILFIEKNNQGMEQENRMSMKEKKKS
jgi:hypothetical protein